MTEVSYQQYSYYYSPDLYFNLELAADLNNVRDRIRRPHNTRSGRKNKKNVRKKKQRRQFIVGKHAYVSAGIIFYKIIDGITYYLFMERTDNSRFKYEDLGGKISDIDESIEDIATREASEESNLVLANSNLELIKRDENLYNEALEKSMNNIKNIIKTNDINPLLYPKIKYALYMVPLSEDIDMSEGGNVEIVHEGLSNYPVERTLKWYNEYELNKIDIKDFNPRIRIMINDLLNK